MTRTLLLLLAFTLTSIGQNRAAAPEDEEDRLQQALAEAGSSPVEFIRAIESHLTRFPQSPRRPDLERALVKAAIDVKDDRRILLYGEKVVERDSDDIETLERVTELLLTRQDKESAQKARTYARRYAEVVRSVEKEEQESPRSKARLREQVDRGLGRAVLLEARASANLGLAQEALALARRSYDSFPTAESAREIGRQLVRMGKESEALSHFADAFSIPDPRNDEIERSRDRQRLGELYRRLKGSENGLGDLILEAYDRTSALLEDRRLKLQALDPNAGVSNPMDFTLSSLAGERFPLASLRGKIVIFDFWATWCGPCRLQHPLYEEVKAKFKENADVVFLSVNTDGEREMVEPFLKENGWNGKVYFDDGLSRALRVSSIPTTIVANRRGEMVGRFVGFIPDRFVAMLTDRIHEALSQ